eukprot:1987213-Prymnesium_polylepis.2
MTRAHELQEAEDEGAVKFGPDRCVVTAVPAIVRNSTHWGSISSTPRCHRITAAPPIGPLLGYVRAR